MKEKLYRYTGREERMISEQLLIMVRNDHSAPQLAFLPVLFLREK